MTGIRRRSVWLRALALAVTCVTYIAARKLLPVGGAILREHVRPHSKSLAVGASATDFALLANDGKQYRLSDLRGRRIVLNFLCGCDRCSAVAPKWQEIYKMMPGVIVLGVSSLGKGFATGWSETEGVTFPILFDPDHSIAQAYNSINCPRSWVVDQYGRIVYVSRAEESPAALGRALKQYLVRSSAERINPEPSRGYGAAISVSSHRGG
jgi:cytochrome c biogenesis protein CcmG/thiol:disulfide interchange protein DsbE